MPVAGIVTVTHNFTKTLSYDLGTPTSSFNQTATSTFVDGVGAVQVNRTYQDSGSLAGAAGVSLDLAGGLTDEFGVVLTFARVKSIYFKNTSVSAVMSIGDNVAASILTIFTDKILVQPGGALSWHAPNAAGAVVTATTADLLRILNEDGAATATYDIIITGGAT